MEKLLLKNILLENMFDSSSIVYRLITVMTTMKNYKISCSVTTRDERRNVPKIKNYLEHIVAIKL